MNGVSEASCVESSVLDIVAQCCVDAGNVDCGVGHAGEIAFVYMLGFAVDREAQASGLKASRSSAIESEDSSISDHLELKRSVGRTPASDLEGEGPARNEPRLYQHVIAGETLLPGMLLAKYDLRILGG